MSAHIRLATPSPARLTSIAAAVIGLGCALPQAFALPLLPGAEVSPTGTTVALRPELAGLVVADTKRHFSVPDGVGGRVRGYLQDRVVRSTETGTLIFSQRIVLDRRSSSAMSPGEWTISGETPVTTDVDYRLDGLGSLGASSSQRGPTGDTVRYKLGRPMAPGESTYFHDMLTNALDFDARGRTTINGTGLPPITLHTYRPTGTPQPYYTATALAPPSPYRFFLNDFGQVSMTVGDDSGFKTLLWQPDQPNGLDGALFAIPQLPGYPYNEAGRINNLGQITGTNYHRGDRGAGVGGDFTERAFLWKPSTTRGSTGEVIDLGVLPGGSYSYARGINDLGEVTGCGDYAGAPTGYGDPLLWSGGTVTEIDRPRGGAFGCGYALNAHGDIAGYGAFVAGTYQGFEWTASSPGSNTGTMVSVDSIGGAPYQGPGVTSDINDSGVAIGGVVLGWPDPSAEIHGYVWGPGGLTDLGARELPEAINNASVGVGSLGGGIARLYRNGRASTLRWFVSPAQGWLLSYGYDVSNVEQITGAGWSPVVGSALILMTPVRISSAAPSPCHRALPLTMTVKGTGFTTSATAVLDGMRLPTLRIDANHLQVTVPDGVMDGGCGGALFIANDDGTSSTVKTF
jgi:hypothetical protein